MRINLTSFVGKLVFGLALGGMFSQAASIQFTPSTLGVGPGGTGGVGFTFSNDQTGYAVLDETQYVPYPGEGGYGTYTDFIGLQTKLLIVPPGQTLTQTYNPANDLGAGQFTLLGSGETTGNLTLFYDVYSLAPTNPSFDSITDYITSSQTSAFIAVGSDVSLPAPPSAPEPGQLGLAGLGFLLLGLASKCRRARSVSASSTP